MIVSLWISLCGRLGAQQNVSLAWNTSSGASGYALYLGSASGSYTQRIDVQTNSTVTLSGLASGQTNYFVVTAYNAAGLESPASSQVAFTAPVIVPPPATNPPPVVTNQPPVVTNQPPVTNSPPPPSSGSTPGVLAITNAGQLIVSAAGVSNLNYVLETSANLQNWNTVNSTPPGQLLTYTVPSQAGACRYYRVLTVTGAVNQTSVAQAARQHQFLANAVGYVKINAAHGYTLLANPFDCGTNTVAALLPTAPSGSVLYKYTTGAGYASNVFSGGHWSDGDMSLEPGEGGFFYNPGTTTQKFVFAGQVLDGTATNFIPRGYSITSPMIPLPNSLGSVPANTGDVIQTYSGQWHSYTNTPSGWIGVRRSTPLTLSPGVAFFITKQSSADWIQSYSPAN